jgi:hypothetical protein
MEIVEFCEDTIGEYRNDKCVVIANYRCVNYFDEQSTIYSIMADKYDFDVYPVVLMNLRVEKVLQFLYGDYDFWIVDKTLMKYFDKDKEKALQNQQSKSKYNKYVRLV